MLNRARAAAGGLLLSCALSTGVAVPLMAAVAPPAVAENINPGDGDCWPYEQEANNADPGIYSEPLGDPEEYPEEQWDDPWWYTEMGMYGY